MDQKKEKSGFYGSELTSSVPGTLGRAKEKRGFADFAVIVCGRYFFEKLVRYAAG